MTNDWTGQDSATNYPQRAAQATGRQRENAGKTRSLWLMLFLAIGAHLGFSWIGFSPTDEGWILAQSAIADRADADKPKPGRRERNLEM